VDPRHLIATFGPIGLFAIIFAECGLLIGFFLPGDSLLFTAGLLSAPRVGGNLHLNLPVVLVGCFVAAVAGAQVGYFIGQRAGPALFHRPESRFFRHDHVERAQRFFTDHGAKTIVLARFVPIVRTFANVVAGVGEMEARTFGLFNLAGGLLWTVGVIMLGYTLGSTVHNIEKYLLPAVAAIVVVSFAPVLQGVLKARKARSGG